MNTCDKALGRRGSAAARSIGSSQAAPLQTMVGLSAVSYGGNAHVVFIDKANSSLSIMTTAAGT